ncbi:multidrug effflux MFS transporter [Nioella sediminis]|uniref:multidrug effflux MFS transporter n=1 Tax=Nioella sediminis TaxID=1912092 RepID=UPI0008FD1347|nr:multidrug effflux MFS transporter [Nioella sediminis]TBX29204.1 multidrug MFS transporter [Roseovarius sp. JS7-11]
MSSVPEVRYLDRSTPPHISTLIAATALGAMSMNIFLPTLPQMAEYFQADYALMQRSVTLYLLINAILQLGIGPISDRFGRRPVLLGSFILFSLATIGCIFAPTAEIFLAFRMAQAVVVAGLVLGRAVVRDIVPGPQAAAMIGYVTMGMALVPMIGPVVGGILGETFGWQANFVLLLATGLAVLALTWFDLGETARASTGGFRDQIREYPELFTSRRFWGYCGATTFASGAFFAYLGGAPYVGSEIYHLTPSQVGFFFGAPALGYFVGNFVAARLSVRLGINRMILYGTSISTAGLLIPVTLHVMGLDSAQTFFGSVTLVGLGNGMTMANGNSGMLSVRPHLAGSASGVGGAVMLAGGALLADLAGSSLAGSATAMPLVAIMLGSSALSIVAIVYTIRRERFVGAG